MKNGYRNQAKQKNHLNSRNHDRDSIRGGRGNCYTARTSNFGAGVDVGGRRRLAWMQVEQCRSKYSSNPLPKRPGAQISPPKFEVL